MSLVLITGVEPEKPRAVGAVAGATRRTIFLGWRGEGRRAGREARGGARGAGAGRRGAVITPSLAGGAGRGRPSLHGGRAQRCGGPQSAPCCRRARTRMSLAVVFGDVRWPPPLPQRRAIHALFSRTSKPVEGSRAFEPARRRPQWI